MLILSLLSLFDYHQYVHTHTKKRGFRLLSFHVLRLSHCLAYKNDNAKPTPNINILSCYIVKVRERA